MKVVRVTLTEFELEDGSTHPIVPPLETPMSVEDFQRNYDRAAQFIESLSPAGSDQ